MTIPKVTEDCVVAVLSKMAKDATGAAQWTSANAIAFTDEQPVVMQTLVENIRHMYKVEDDVPAEVAAGQTMYLAMLTYKLVKTAVEGEKLNEMFQESEE